MRAVPAAAKRRENAKLRLSKGYRVKNGKPRSTSTWMDAVKSGERCASGRRRHARVFGSGLRGKMSAGSGGVRSLRKSLKLKKKRHSPAEMENVQKSHKCSIRQLIRFPRATEAGVSEFAEVFSIHVYLYKYNNAIDLFIRQRSDHASSAVHVPGLTTSAPTPATRPRPTSSVTNRRRPRSVRPPQTDVASV
ncbi:hypothetical protein EVAR_86845_1 [Eumeta japonica]|uniref:Uncharacterized protein n=1 Tax=Eumeta variegata TaxID=151549 RepID=A0A4C1VVK5_EUMVA|nr:hypothetical protein EVAR_86845_1 [Eumeta japonica]